MTNPDNIVRVRARNGGRASVYEANGWAQAYSGGLLEGNGVIQNTSVDMNVLVGGSASKPDVALAENPAGYKIALDLVGQQAVAITAPASNSRISAIVAYTDDLSLASTEDTVTGSPASCGLIVVNGTAAASPSAPTDTQIRSAITSDGATGSQAAYVVIATVEVSSTTTIITDSLITMNVAQIGSDNIDFATLSYSPGETITIGSVGTEGGVSRVIVSGAVTTSAKEILFSVPTPKQLNKITSVELIDSACWIRTPSGGYIGSQGVNILDVANVTVSAGAATPNIITVSALLSTGSWTPTNNIPITIQGGFAFALS